VLPAFGAQIASFATHLGQIQLAIVTFCVTPVVTSVARPAALLDRHCHRGIVAALKDPSPGDLRHCRGWPAGRDDEQQSIT